MANQATMIKLFVSPVSQPARAVMIFSKMANIPHELVNVNLADLQEVQDILEPINPKKQVPVLQHD